MTQTRTTEEAIIRIIEAYGDRAGQWVRISEIAQATDLSREEIGAAVSELLLDDDFQAEPDQLQSRLTERDQWFAPVIGGEARHLIRWME